MARYRTTIETPLSPAEAFAYLADFSNAEEWDPGVVRAERLTPGDPGPGSRFRLVARVLGRDVPLDYEIVDIEPDARVRFRAENTTVVSDDRLTFEPVEGGGTAVTYDADLQLKGVFRVADPALGPAFRRIGAAAEQGLRDALASPDRVR